MLLLNLCVIYVIKLPNFYKLIQKYFWRINEIDKVILFENTSYYYI